MRIGFGFDTHRLAEGSPLVVGGVGIPHTSGTIGHSDADVLIHAICDALFGAAAMRDIGFHFPDTDPAYKGIKSTLLLEETCRKIAEAGYVISNIDTTIVLQSPKLSSFIPEMINILSQVMNIHPAKISVKAKTSEKLGFIGREEGVSAYAIALLE